LLGSVVAQLAFWPLLGIGVMFGEIRWRGAVAFVLLWILGVFGLGDLLPSGDLFVTPYLAILDIVLTLIVFKGDVRLS
jgi:hypothetical protein